MAASIPFTSSDPWLLHAILLAGPDGRASLEDIVAAGDMINHAMLTFHELDGGVARLVAGGFLSTCLGGIQIESPAREIWVRASKLTVPQATDAIRAALGAPTDAPPFKPTPADPTWTSGAFTRQEMAEAEAAYRKRFSAALRKLQGREGA
jgi:hypothetical protein